MPSVAFLWINRVFLVAMAAALWGGAGSASAATVRIGVASNFAAVLEVLKEDFQNRTGHRLVLSAGSTGKLFTQVKNGAPLDLILAADVERPRRLEDEGDAVPGSRFTYAAGRIVLWSSRPGVVDSEGNVLRKGRFRRLAIANPVTAPYGLAAQQVLQKLGVWQALQPRLVRGENITQTFQFVASGNAEMGFVALAQLRARGELGGSAWEVPETHHRPIEQQAVMLRRAQDPDAAKAFLGYLRENSARKILQRFGYRVPDHRMTANGG